MARSAASDRSRSGRPNGHHAHDGPTPAGRSLVPGAGAGHTKQGNAARAGGDQESPVHRLVRPPGRARGAANTRHRPVRAPTSCGITTRNRPSSVPVTPSAGDEGAPQVRPVKEPPIYGRADHLVGRPPQGGRSCQQRQPSAPVDGRELEVQELRGVGVGLVPGPPWHIHALLLASAVAGQRIALQAGLRRPDLRSRWVETSPIHATRPPVVLMPGRAVGIGTAALCLAGRGTGRAYPSGYSERARPPGRQTRGVRRPVVYLDANQWSCLAERREGLDDVPMCCSWPRRWPGSELHRKRGRRALACEVSGSRRRRSVRGLAFGVCGHRIVG